MALNLCPFTASPQEALFKLAPLTLDPSALGFLPNQLWDLQFPIVVRFLYKLRVQECSSSHSGTTSRCGREKGVPSISPRTSRGRGLMVGSKGSARKEALRCFCAACWREGSPSHTDVFSQKPGKTFMKLKMQRDWRNSGQHGLGIPALIISRTIEKRKELHLPLATLIRM